MRLSTLVLGVVIVALGLAVIVLQRRLADRDRTVLRLKLAGRRQGQFLRMFATPGKERDDLLRRFEESKGWFDMQEANDRGE